MKKYITFNESIKTIISDVEVENATLTKIPASAFDLECVCQIFSLDNPDIFARWDYNYKTQDGIISLLNPPPIELEGLVKGETLQAKSGELIVRAESKTTIYYTISTEIAIYNAVEDLKKKL